MWSGTAVQANREPNGGSDRTGSGCKYRTGPNQILTLVRSVRRTGSPAEGSLQYARMRGADADLSGLEQRILVLVEVRPDAIRARLGVSGAQRPARAPLFERHGLAARRNGGRSGHPLPELEDGLLSASRATSRRPAFALQ